MNEIPRTDDHLVRYLVPAFVTLCSFFDYVPTGKIQHLFQR